MKLVQPMRLVAQVPARGLLILVLGLPAGGCDLADLDDAREVTSADDTQARLPAPEGWTDRGIVFGRGPPGAWDHLLYGGFAGTVVEKGGALLLYYQGARDYDEALGTVTDRAIGLASSRDGLRFEKHPNNPVITWQPKAGPEEGAASGTAILSDSGEIILYYGANTELDKRNVRADARVALSADGLQFTDHGVVLDASDGGLWGHGDEIFPVAALSDDEYTYVYYLPNGSGLDGRLGVAWGPAWNDLRWSGEVRTIDGELQVWGMASAVRLHSDSYALFLNERGGHGLHGYLVDLRRPWELQRRVVSYEFANMVQGIVYRDSDTRTWYLYYRARGGEGYGVRTAALD